MIKFEKVQQNRKRQNVNEKLQVKKLNFCLDYKIDFNKLD